MLKREIRKWDLVLLFINGTIGAGIFGLPSKVFALSGFYSLHALFACAFIVFVLVMVFAEVASKFDKTGGPYLYMLEAFGKVPAFTIGWLILITRVATYAALMNLMVTYLSYFYPNIQSPLLRNSFIIGLTVLLTWVNFIGIRASTRVNNFLAFAKMLPLAVFILVGLYFIDTSLIDSGQAFPPMTDFSSSVLVLFFAFTGFEAILVNTGEIKNPQKNIPFALIVSMTIIAIFYAMIQWVSMGTLPTLAASNKPITDAAQLFMGFPGTVMITIGAMFSIGGTLNSVMLIASRLPFAMSEEGQFPVWFSHLHSKYKTPIYSLLAFAVVSLMMSLSGSFISAVSISVISKVMIFLSICMAHLKLRNQSFGHLAHFKLKYGYILAIIGMFFSLYLLYSSQLAELFAVLITVAIGLALFFIFKGRKDK